MRVVGRRTALVTGASHGLGRELARLFAADGFDVALVARTGAELEELAQELEMRHEVATHVLPIDLAHPVGAAEVVAELQARRVRVDALVNSAALNRVGPFAEAEDRRVLELLQVNLGSLTHLTRLVLPGMLQRRWGRIVNLCSSSAFRPGPMMAEAQASRAYVLSLSMALAQELRGTGVQVIALCPPLPARTASTSRPRVLVLREESDLAELAAWAYRQVKRGRPCAVRGARWRAVAFGERVLPRPPWLRRGFGPISSGAAPTGRSRTV